MISLEKKPRVQREVMVKHLITEEETMIPRAAVALVSQSASASVFSAEIQVPTPLAVEDETVKQLKERLQAVEKEANAAFKAFAWSITIMLFILFAFSFVLGNFVFPDIKILFEIFMWAFGCTAIVALGTTINGML